MTESRYTTGRERGLEHARRGGPTHGLGQGLNQGRSRATLVLEDGSVFGGWRFAGEGEVAGEVVFTTSMVGYQ